METTKHLTSLVDGDLLIYRCGFSADSQKKRWFKDNVNNDPTAEELADFLAQEDYLHFALGNVKECLTKFAEMFDGSKMRVFLTGDGNFREQVATLLPYKGNRDELHKPKYYQEIKQYMIHNWNAEVVHGQEADDALSIAQYAAKDDSTVIISIDKDLDQVPGWHYNFVKDNLYYVEEEAGDLRLFHQMLVGDRTDNIPGIKGIGDVKADKLIYKDCNSDIDRVREEVKKLYQKEYGNAWEGAYFEVGALLWMRREEGQEECPLL